MRAGWGTATTRARQIGLAADGSPFFRRQQTVAQRLPITQSCPESPRRQSPVWSAEGDDGALGREQPAKFALTQMAMQPGGQTVFEKPPNPADSWRTFQESLARSRAAGTWAPVHAG
jgi:hypothetical protein